MLGDEHVDDFEENVSCDEFVTFLRSAVELNLHMVLNDPPIQLAVEPWEKMKSKEDTLERFDFWMYQKADYYCIDGFPTEGMPGVVVLPAPMRAGYVYQGLKPAVIVFNKDNLEDEELFKEGENERIMD